MDKLHLDFLATLPIKQESPREREVKREFFAWLEALKQKGERPTIAYGALGEAIGRDGYVKQVHREDGVQLELWGLSYKLKLNLNGWRLHNLELAKALISEVPREILPKYTFLTILNRRKFMKRFGRFIFVIMARSVRWNQIPIAEYNSVAREVHRAGMKVVKDKYGFDMAQYDFSPFKSNIPDPENWGHILAYLTYFVALFLELDVAYRFRVQDAFRGDFWQGLETLLQRETAQGIGQKWKFLKTALKIGFWLYPEVKQFIDALMREIDWEKVKMDEADWYYCLRYVSYNFGGLSEAERFAERDRLDKEKEHVLLFA